eukprot:7933887-Ditylum_brightwellii.AAC.1
MEQVATQANQLIRDNMQAVNGQHNAIMQCIMLAMPQTGQNMARPMAQHPVQSQAIHQFDVQSPMHHTPINQD